ncbi:unnamed protein product [Mytilus coruscus]|uniref:C1q domain-containing protein n=1 Tax=Mytilus coruscus TaxID=42192 RepID=A0A6J8CXS7_MYTCO|nr:unnamed protein product [Mytilus coruscus]
MLRHKYLPILIVIWMNYSCKCQDLEKFVAPIVDNRGAPLVAIVNTTNISSHIVRSIEMPLREIINSTVECRISEMLKDEVDSLQQNTGDNRNQMTEVIKDIATLREEMKAGERISREILEQLNNLNKTVSTVSTGLDEKVKKLANNMDAMQLKLQQKIDEHIGDNRNQMTGVKQDIATLRKEMEDRITREILDKMNYLTRSVSTEKKDLDEKMKKLTNNVDVMQSDLKETIVSVDSNVTNLAGKLENHLSSLEMLRSNLQELTVNTSTIQNAIGNIKTTSDFNDGRLSVQVSKLENLKATVNDMNLRVALSACVASSYTASPSSAIKFPDIKTSEGITNQHLTSFKSSGVFVCEVPGLYHISVVIMSNTNKAYVKISKNNIVLIKGNIDNYYTEHQLDYHSNAAIVVTELQKDDRIDIKPGKDMLIQSNSYSCLTIVKVK